MSASLLRVLTLAGATAREILRRPSAHLALIGAGVLLLIVPRLAQRALDDGAALGAELALSTVWLYATVFAALTGARAAAPDAPLGPTAEFLVTPLRVGEYVVARAAGVTAAVASHALLLLALAAIALAWAGSAPDSLAALLAAVLVGMLQVPLFAAAGLALGALCGAQLGSVAILAYLVLARLLVPALTGEGDPWSWWLPDPARLDVAREAAFARALGGSALAAAVAAALLQCAALLVAARALLFLGRPAGSAPSD